MALRALPPPMLPPRKIGKTRKGFFARAFDAIAYSQMKRAERELSRYRDLLPPDFVLRGNLRSDDRERDAVRRLVSVKFFTSEAAPVFPARGGFVFAASANRG